MHDLTRNTLAVLFVCALMFFTGWIVIPFLSASPALVSRAVVTRGTICCALGRSIGPKGETYSFAGTTHPRRRSTAAHSCE